MNPRIQHLINHPFEVQLSDVALLQDEIEKYPYFSTLRTLLLFGLKEFDHSSYQEELKKTSIYCPSRVALYHYLQKEKQESTEVPVDEKPEEILETNSVETQYEYVFKQSHEEIPSEEVVHIADDSIFEEEFVPEEEITVSEFTSNQTEDVQESKPEVLSSEMTFTQWLTLSKNKGEKSETETKSTPESPSEKDIKFQLIEEFIEKSPKISPIAKETTYKPVVSKSSSSEEYSDLMTETLAQIYTEQRKFDKAIRAYKILMLKYPEKEELFAEKIEQIEAMKG